MSQLYGTTEYPNTFKRQGSFPLDNSTVFSSLMEANEYAKSSKIAYEGQVISIIEDDMVYICFLKKSDNPGENFKIINFSIHDFNEYVIDMHNLINTKIGTWNICKKQNSDNAVLDFDIWYGVIANAYEVYFNDELVSDKLSLIDEFITNIKQFKKDSIKIKLKFYLDDMETFELEAKPVYKNKTVITGSLHLTKII